MDLPLRFFLDGDHYVLVEGKHAEYDEDFEEIGPWEAEKLLAQALSERELGTMLRAGLGGHAGGGSWDDHQRFAQRVGSEVGGETDRLVLLRRRRPLFSLVFTEPIVDDLTDLIPEENEEDTWIEVRVIDEDGEPVSSMEYEIELSDGRVRQGRTSELGILRYDGIPSGSCKVKLLGVEANGWNVA